MLFLYKNFKISRIKAPEIRCFKEQRKDTVDKNTSGSNSLKLRFAKRPRKGEKGGIHRRRYQSLRGSIHATLGKCQGTGRMEGTLTTWCIVINEAHSWRKTLRF